MSDDPQFIATPSPFDQTAVANAAVLKPAAASIMPMDNLAMSQTDNDEHKTLREERLEYWKGKNANPEYLRSKKFDRNLAEEAGAELDQAGKIRSVTPELLTNLEEKMYVYIEQARRNLEESKRFDNSDTFSPTEVIERLQRMVSTDPESELHQKV